jgi:hypothetical protein
VPMYVAIAYGLSRLAPAVTWVVLATMAPLLMLWSALFGAQWPLC